MKFFYVITLLTLVGKVAAGQTVDMSATVNNSIFTNNFINPLDNLLTRQEINDISSAKAATFESVGGTNRFLSIDWETGGAVTYQNKIVNSTRYKYNYDYISHQLFAKSGDTVIAVNGSHLKSFYITVNGRTHAFYKFPAIGSDNFEELLSADTVAGKLRLIKQRNVTLIKYTQANASAALTGDRSDIYQGVVNYFILFPDNVAVKVKLSSKSVMESLEPQYRAKAIPLINNTKKIDEDSLARIINSMNGN